MSPLESALSGIQSAQLRIGASAHNVANLQTEGFRPLRADQLSRPEGGSHVYVSQEAAPRDVDLARELVDQMLAGHQLNANLRVASAAGETLGRLVDILA